jgi:hypothetical protein
MQCTWALRKQSRSGSAFNGIAEYLGKTNSCLKMLFRVQAIFFCISLKMKSMLPFVRPQQIIFEHKLCAR